MTAAFAALRAELTDDNERSVPVDASSFALPKVQFRVSGVAGDCSTPHLPWGGLDVHAFLDRALVANVGGIAVRYLARDDSSPGAGLSDVRKIGAAPTNSKPSRPPIFTS